jgi:general secretion pathway protein D
MNKIKQYWVNVLLSFLVSTAMMGGCAGKPIQSDLGGMYSKEKKAASASEKLQNKVEKVKVEPLHNPASEYEVIETPFGYIKRRKPRQAPPSPPSVQENAAVLSEKTAGSVDSSPEDQGKRDQSVLNTAALAKNIPPTRDKEGDVLFNFDDADLSQVIRAFAELLHINFIISSNIQGSVNIHMTHGVDKKSIWPIFYQILEINGLTAVKEGHFYRIIKAKEAARSQISYKISGQGPEVSPSQKFVIEIIPLKYIKASEMATLIKPFISSDGTIISHEQTNTLILVDRGSAVLKALKMVAVFDVDLFKKVGHRFYTLKYMEAEDMGTLLNSIVAGYGNGSGQDVKLVPIQRLNTLLVLSKNQHLLNLVDGYIHRLDVPGENVTPKIYVYHVRNGSADDLGPLVQSIFSENTVISKTEGKKEEKASPVGEANPFLKTAEEMNAKEKKAGTKEKAGGGASSGLSREAQAIEARGGVNTLRGELKITVDNVRNALIIQALPSDYLVVKNILKQIDVMPRQVLIQVTIADITLDKSTDLGLNWSFLNSNLGLSPTVQITGDPTGLQYAVSFYDKWRGALTALAKKNKVKILSCPSVLASDNKAATIDVNTQIPVASSEFQYQSGTGVTQTSIQYLKTGITLNVTPHISDSGMVTMDIGQKVSNQATAVKINGTDYPEILERSVTTTLTVGQRQTIIMGGLIQDQRSNTDSGVPILNRIPFLKFLAGSHGTNDSRKELVISITPHVILNTDDVDSVTREFKRNIGPAQMGLN